MFRTPALLRVLGRTALILYFLAAALFLVVKYGILPNIDHWRPRIQAELSSTLNTPVTLGRIEARWNGLYPHIQLNDVALFDSHGRPALQLPHIRATLSWQGLLSGLPRFSYIEATGLHISARRDARQRIWILGQDIADQAEDDASEVGLDHPAIQWLAQQPRVALRDAQITWQDDTRDAGPLHLESVVLGLNSAPGKHQMVLSAAPPQLLGRRFEMRGEFNHVDQSLARVDPLGWEGTLYIEVDGMSPAQWQPWVDVPVPMHSGEVSVNWWLTFAKAQPQRVAVQVRVESGHWQLGSDSSLQVGKANLFVDGSWSGYAANVQAVQALFIAEPTNDEHGAATPDPVFRRDNAAEGEPVKMRLDASDLVLDLPQVFSNVLAFERVRMQGDLRRNAADKLVAGFDDVRVINRDMDLQLAGTWTEGGDGAAGLADLRGVFHRALLDGIDVYLPESVNLDAREWLINGLLDGQLENAQAMIQGDLQHFPFGDGSGRFHIEGDFTGGVIDYAPGVTPETSWPALRQVNGRASLDRVELRLVADEAVVNPAEGHVIQLRNVVAQIPNIERDSVLAIQGETHASAPAYLALARYSPLRSLLDGFLDPAQADGEWHVPLRLTIPLLNVDDTRVNGSVLFQGGKVALDPVAPPFEQVRGRLDFSETGLSAAEGLEARFLDGPAVFSGGIGGDRKGLTLSGSIGAPALKQYVGMKGMERLKGALAYQAQIVRRASGRYALTAQSDLKGMAVDLPAPVGKSANAGVKLDVQWQPANTASDMHLNVALGTQVKARFVRREGRAQGPYFHVGFIGTAAPDKLPSTGLLVDVRYPQIDVDEWDAIIDEFSTPLPGQGSSGRALFPPLQRMRLQADHITLYGLKLETATLTAHREQALRWRMDVTSAQTAGTLYWHQAEGSSLGRVDAQFDRLALGAEPEKEAAKKSTGQALLDSVEEDGSWDSEVDIPAIDLKVDKLSLYGRQVGRLTVEGVNEQEGKFWRLNKLSLTSPSAQLKGVGIWRLAGPQRGLTVDAEVNFSDAGAFLNQIDLKDLMAGGQGSLKGRFEWRNMPWRFKRSDLNGQLRLELENGRFSTLNSRSARLLELLSLQSIQRLATFSLNPAAVFKEGFPFDRVSGTIHIENGVLTTNDYRVSSPAAAISIGGDVDLTTEKLQLQAMVVPNLDVSGATLAAGIINPVVGLGAFVTQWLLSKPLSKAMTVHYNVTGDLDSPQLREAAASEPVAPVPDEGQIKGGELELNDADGGVLRDAGELNGSAAGIKKNGG